MAAYDAIRLEGSWHVPLSAHATPIEALPTATTFRADLPQTAMLRVDEPSTLAMGVVGFAILMALRSMTVRRTVAPARISASSRPIKPRRRAA